MNNDRDPAVVLVHGIEPERDFFVPISFDLSVRHFKPLFFQFDDSRPLDQSADRLLEAIATIPGGGPVRIIAHSMGGLVARRALTEGRPLTLAGSARPVLLVTVATPFHGYSSANATNHPILGLFARLFGLKPSFRDLASSSKFVREPGTLGENITHLKIETYETKRGDITAHCRDQAHETIDAGARAIDAIATGHVESFKTDAYTVSRELKSKLIEHGALDQDPAHWVPTTGRKSGCLELESSGT